MVVKDAELYYTFDDVDLSLGSPQDVSGNGNHGTNAGATTGGTGILNEGFSFTTNDRVIIPQITPDGADWSMSVWFKTNNTTASVRTIFSYRSTNNNDWIRINLQADHSLTTQIDDGSNPLFVYNSGATLYNDNVWHNIILTRTFSTGTFELWLDGVSVHTQNDIESAISESGSMNVGAFSVSDVPREYWEGNIDELGIWRRKLSDTEVADLYNGGVGFNPYTPTDLFIGPVMKGVGEITKAKITIPTECITGDVPTMYLKTASGDAWEEVSNGVEHTFANSGTELYVKLTANGTVLSSVGDEGELVPCIIVKATEVS